MPFGVLLCVGALHREFTIFALPAIALLQWLEARRDPLAGDREVRRGAGPDMDRDRSAETARQHRRTRRGPRERRRRIAGARSRSGRTAALVSSIGLPRAASLLLTQGGPDLFGARPLPLFVGGIWGEGSVGSVAAGLCLAAALVSRLSRLAWIAVTKRVHKVRFQCFCCWCRSRRFSPMDCTAAGDRTADRTELRAACSLVSGRAVRRRTFRLNPRRTSAGPRLRSWPDGRYRQSATTPELQPAVHPQPS